MDIINNLSDKVLHPYRRRVQYYETDQMGVVHHSNYIRWFEEARIDFMEQMGLSYAELESMGIMIPVLGVACEYKVSVRFQDSVLIYPVVSSFNGMKMTISYTVTDSENKILYSTGESKHCFLNKSFKPVSLKRDFPKVYDTFNSWTGRKAE